MSERVRFRDKASGFVLAGALALSSGVLGVVGARNLNLRFEPKVSFDSNNNSLSYGFLAGVNVGNTFPNYLGTNIEETVFFGPNVTGRQKIETYVVPGQPDYYSQCSDTNLQDDNSLCEDKSFTNKE